MTRKSAQCQVADIDTLAAYLAYNPGVGSGTSNVRIMHNQALSSWIQKTFLAAKPGPNEKMLQEPSKNALMKEAE